ncbi:MAG: hypothetical protein ACK2UB_11525 [Anaerolineales bacterium]
MNDRIEPWAAEERNLQRIVKAACRPDAPPLPAGLPESLAARSRRAGARPKVDLPLVAAVCSTAGVLLLIVLTFLPAGRMDLRLWAVVLPALNILLAPFAAWVVVRHMRGGVLHAET